MAVWLMLERTCWVTFERVVARSVARAVLAAGLAGPRAEETRLMIGAMPSSAVSEAAKMASYQVLKKALRAVRRRSVNHCFLHFRRLFWLRLSG